MTFDDGPTPYTDRLVDVLRDAGAKATFFMIGNKVAAEPGRRQARRRGRHGDRQPHLGTPQHDDHPRALRSGAVVQGATRRSPSATGQTPTLWRPAGGLTDDAVNQQAAKDGLAGILWDVIPFDWINDADTAATRYMLMTQIKPGSVVLLHDSYSSTVDLVEQFIPVLKANGYHLVTVSQLLGDRAPGSVYGGRENGPPANVLHDIPADQIPALPATPSPAPMPNFPITDIPGANSGGPNNGI